MPLLSFRSRPATQGRYRNYGQVPKKERCKEVRQTKSAGEEKRASQSVENTGEESQTGEESCTWIPEAGVEKDGQKNSSGEVFQIKWGRKRLQYARPKRAKFIRQEPQNEKARSIYPFPKREAAPTARCDGRLDGWSREGQP